MTKEQRKAFDALKELGCPVRTWHVNSPGELDYRGIFWISAEEPLSPIWLDYYDKYEGSDKLNEILDEAGLYFEWENAGFACVFEG